eukprot:Seg8151.2 transcript_id=Seg8151.2/GoldUCD/mRNA.D3Y31 product="hypothetical protein" protein_id=Seg8151.2/GoldUCD/D3Y31
MTLPKITQNQQTFGDMDERGSNNDSNGFPMNGDLMPIFENLDADDESSSDLESDSDGKDNNKKRARRTSLSMTQYVYNNKNKQTRQRKTSCIEIFPHSRRDSLGQVFATNNASLPSIKRSMSLPESFENYEQKKVPQGSRSATERLQLPDIGQLRATDSIRERDFNNNRNFRYLPNLAKHTGQNGTLDVHQRNKSESKKLDIFMRNHFR